MPHTLRLLPFRSAAGTWHMAADEALLASAAEGTASLRFYVWDEATLSLGYFQPSAPARSRPGLAALPWLRRPSGGSALVHHHEVTYALALPPGAEWQPPGGACLSFVHEAIRDALATLGVTTQLCKQERKRGEALCFLHHTPCDLLLGDDKVVGSAQRKTRGALLQHGGILLRRSPHAPELPGINDLAGAELAPQEAARAVTEALARRGDLAIEPGDWSADEEARAADLAVSRYAGTKWNARR